MAEEKKGRSSRGGQKVQSKRSTPLKESKTGATKQAKAQTKGVRSEIKGLVLMGFAILALIGMAGVETGIWGSIISGIFSYGFGLGGWVVALWVLYNGWCWLYKGSLAAITRKGLLYTGVLLVVLVQLVLWKVNNGDELSTTTLTENGGVVGGLLGSLFRNLVGDVGGILLSAIIGIACVLGITKLSLREGLHKAKDKASVGLEIAQEKATETASAIREQVHEWQEEWREERRKAYDREKDTRYPKTEDSSDEIEVEADAVIETQEAISRATGVEVSGANVVDIESMGPSESMIDTEELEAMEPSKDVTIMQPPMEDYEDEEAYIPEPHIREDEVVTSTSEVESVVAPPMVDSAEETEEDTSGEIYTTDVDEEPHVTEVSTELEPITPPSFLQTTNYVGSLVEVPTIETTKEDTAAVAVNTDGVARPRTIEKPYQYPPLTMLSQGKSNPVTSEEVAHNAVLLEETLDNFGITAKVVNATQGPTVTRYELEPAKGTKVSRIMG